MQLPLIEPQSSWTPPNINDLPDWSNAQRVGIDTETYDPTLKTLGSAVRRGGFIAGVSFAIEDGPKFYLPIRHKGGDNMDCQLVLTYLREQAKNFRGELVGANLDYDLDWLAQEGIVYRNVRRFRDVMVADPLIYELHHSYSLNNIAKRWGFPGKDESKLREAAATYKLNPKSDMWMLPARYVGRYAEIDAELPLRVLRKQERTIEEENLWDIYNLESKLIPILVKMKRRGVLIDQDKLACIREWSIQEEIKFLNEVKRQTGVTIGVNNVWTVGALVPALTAAGIQLPQTETGKPSVTKDFLVSVNNPVATMINKAREVNKLRTTFVESVENHMTNGRLHCNYNQMARDDNDGGVKGARFGRMSCEKPNIQQQPARGEFAPLWRSIYLPDEGKYWTCNDFSQQEPRLTTHYAEQINAPGARQAGDAYRNNPDNDNHAMMAEITGLPRKGAKSIYLGICYGMGGAKLAHQLGLPTKWIVLKRNGKRLEVAGDQAQRILDTFDEKAPFVRELSKFAKAAATKRGYITTLLGRRLHFPMKDDGTYDWVHKALNRVIQGGAADQMKQALVDVEEAGYKPQMQVHDELDGSVENRAEAEAMAEIMQNAVTLTVPAKVDVEMGHNWGEISEDFMC